jgi:hypothetical protein
MEVGEEKPTLTEGEIRAMILEHHRLVTADLGPEKNEIVAQSRLRVMEVIRKAGAEALAIRCMESLYDCSRS